MLAYYIFAVSALDRLIRPHRTCVSLWPPKDMKKEIIFQIFKNRYYFRSNIKHIGIFLSFNDFREEIKSATDKGNVLNIKSKVLKKFAFPVLKHIGSFLDSNPRMPHWGKKGNVYNI